MHIQDSISKYCPNLFRRLQSVQNAAARLIMGSWQNDHITPVLRAPLASRASACRFQAGCAGLQSTSWSDGAVPRPRLSTHRLQRRSSQVAVGGHRHLHRSSNKHATRWQKLCGRWSTALELSASRTASARHRAGGISTATENVFAYVRHRRLVTFVVERLINIWLLLLLLLW